MTYAEAWQQVASKLTDLQDRQLRTGLPPLTDLTDSERLFEIRARLNALEHDGATMPLLAAIGAHLVAFMRAVHARETVDVASGDETAGLETLTRAARTPKDAA